MPQRFDKAHVLKFAMVDGGVLEESHDSPPGERRWSKRKVFIESEGKLFQLSPTVDVLEVNCKPRATETNDSGTWEILYGLPSLLAKIPPISS